MTTYSTQNPLGSSDPRDLYDNAENLDNFVNGEQPAYNDRLGKSRKSWQGMEDEFAAFIAASGYEFVGDYAAGIEITGYNQVVRDTGGEFWRVSGSTALPYTTTGSGLPEGGAFVAVGDAALRQELGGALSSGLGASLVNGATIYVGSVAELASVTPNTDKSHYSVAGYHPDSSYGGGVFYWDSTRNKADHDGGTVIDPDLTFPVDWASISNVDAWFTPAISGSGCFVRSPEYVDSRSFGDKGTEVYGDTEAQGKYADYLKALSSGSVISSRPAVKTFTVSVPTDYPTIQDAFDALSGYIPASGEEIVVNFEAGHQPTTGLSLVGGDYSRYRITSTDRPCVVAAALSTGLFRFERCSAPVIDTLFDMSAVTASVIGYAAYAGTTGTITPTNGIIFSPGTGLYAEGSYITAQAANFNNASNLIGSEDSGIAAWEGAIVNADGATCIESWVGVNAGFGGTINFMGGTANNCRRHNIRAREKGNVNCQQANCSGATAYNIYAWKASNINAREAICQNAGEISVNAVEASVIAARGVTTDGSVIGIKALQGSTVDAPFSSNDNCTDTAVVADQASTVNVESGTGVNATTRSILAIGASTINATLFNGNGGVEVRADACSRIAARGATTPSFRVETGSLMSISTFTSTNITPNTLDPKGIIFQSP